MNDRLQDFIPFTAEVYFRLLERVGEAFWQQQLLTLALTPILPPSTRWAWRW